MQEVLGMGLRAWGSHLNRALVHYKKLKLDISNFVEIHLQYYRNSIILDFV
jgi:hypothetical protein